MLIGDPGIGESRKFIFSTSINSLNSIKSSSPVSIPLLSPNPLFDPRIFWPIAPPLGPISVIVVKVSLLVVVVSLITLKLPLVSILLILLLVVPETVPSIEFIFNSSFKLLFRLVEFFKIEFDLVIPLLPLLPVVGFDIGPT